MNKKTSIIVLVVVLVVIAGGAFYGGMLYGKSQSAASLRSNFSAFRGTRTGANGANFILGDIISEDSSSITLQLPNNGGSKIIFYSATTQITKTDSGTADDLKTGASVSVSGTTNSDGSVTANSIQIRPAGVNPGGPNRPTTVSPGQTSTQ